MCGAGATGSAAVPSGRLPVAGSTAGASGLTAPSSLAPGPEDEVTCAETSGCACSRPGTGGVLGARGPSTNGLGPPVPDMTAGTPAARLQARGLRHGTCAAGWPVLCSVDCRMMLVR